MGFLQETATKPATTDTGTFGQTYWQPRIDLDFEDWLAAGQALGQMGNSINWWVGDWLAHGNHKWGEKYAQGEVATGLNTDTLVKCQWVATNVHREVRTPDLSWTHHSHVASLPEEAQQRLLNLAIDYGWNTRILKKQADLVRSFISGGNSAKESLAKLKPESATIEFMAPLGTALDDGIDTYEGEEEDPRTDFQKGLFSSDSVEWYTPARYIEAARKVLGYIHLDPASCAKANETVQAETFYTIKEDGLTSDWFGNVWLNPPYGVLNGASVQGIWSGHAHKLYNEGVFDAGIMLINANTGRSYFSQLFSHPICFTDHYIRFIDQDGVIGSQPMHPNAFVYLGTDHDFFDEVFSEFGNVVIKRTQKVWVVEKSLEEE